MLGNFVFIYNYDVNLNDNNYSKVTKKYIT